MIIVVCISYLKVLNGLKGELTIKWTSVPRGRGSKKDGRKVGELEVLSCWWQCCGSGSISLWIKSIRANATSGVNSCSAPSQNFQAPVTSMA